MNAHHSYPGLESLAYGRPWAIMPEKLEVMEAFLRGWMAGHRLSADELQEKYGAASPRNAKTARGVAVIPIYGVISQRMNMLSAMSGGTSTELLGDQFQSALDNPEVGSIVFDVDSPGGSVSGIAELADKIYAGRSQKKIIAVSNTLMASAAYHLSAAAHEIVVSPSSETGSIGVYAMHRDRSQLNATMGIKPTYISAGKYKVEGNPDMPLEASAITAMQQQVDDFYSMFTGAVAKFRKVAKSDVVNGYGEGRVVTAKRAVALGMADRVGTFDDVMSELLGGSNETRKRALSLEQKRLELAAL